MRTLASLLLFRDAPGRVTAEKFVLPINLKSKWPLILKLKKKSENLEGTYANYFEVGYNAFEFVMDFGQYFSENDTAELCTRIITSPAYAMDFFNVLGESIEHYKAKYDLPEDE